jgi:hypothetical protein
MKAIFIDFTKNISANSVYYFLIVFWNYIYIPQKRLSFKNLTETLNIERKVWWVAF